MCTQSRSVAGLSEQLSPLFLPRSVAVVGAPRGTKPGKMLLLGLLDQGFQGPIYPVNPQAAEIEGLKAYPSVSAIPGPVDLAIVLVSRRHISSVLQECAAKGIKGAVLFTSGYGETGSAEGRAEENALAELAESAGMRLIGPNCMGLYVPEAGLSFFPGLPREGGPVGVISQSGSLANIIVRLAAGRGLRFSKVVSLGNEADLVSADFLQYMGEDPSTHLIGVYLEGVKKGRYFLNTLKAVSKKKPVIIWKAGVTDDGGRAAASHTGALGGSPELWQTVVRQGGAVSVRGVEEMVESLMGFQYLDPCVGDRLAIVSGPGGLAVAAADACGINGLRLAALSSPTRQRLAEFVPPTGTSLRNPIDVGLSASMDVDIFAEAARAVAADPNVDGVLVIGVGLTPEANKRYVEAMVQARAAYRKPFLVVGIAGFDLGLSSMFFEKGVPYFQYVESAVRTYARVCRYGQGCRQLVEGLHRSPK